MQARNKTRSNESLTSGFQEMETLSQINTNPRLSSQMICQRNRCETRAASGPDLYQSPATVWEDVWVFGSDCPWYYILQWLQRGHGGRMEGLWDRFTDSTFSNHCFHLGDEMRLLYSVQSYCFEGSTGLLHVGRGRTGITASIQSSTRTLAS